MIQTYFRLALAALTLSLTTLFSACAVGPFYVHETARTVGKGKNEFTAGYGKSEYTFNWAQGLTDRFDFGVHWESYGLGLRAKYALTPPSDRRWNTAVAFGGGFSSGGHHFYTDFMASYLSKSGVLEPYGLIRILAAQNDESEFRTANGGKPPFVMPPNEYLFAQLVVGNRFWLDERWILSVEASKLLGITNNLTLGDAYTVGAALGYRLSTPIF